MHWHGLEGKMWSDLLWLQLHQCPDNYWRGPDIQLCHLLCSVCCGSCTPQCFAVWDMELCRLRNHCLSLHGKWAASPSAWSLLVNHITKNMVIDWRHLLFYHSQVTEALKQVKFKLDNQSIEFDENGDPPAHYDIVHWDCKNKTCSNVDIGSYLTNPTPSFHINETLIHWFAGTKVSTKFFKSMQVYITHHQNTAWYSN